MKHTNWRMAEDADDLCVSMFKVGSEPFVTVEIDGVGIVMPGNVLLDLLDELAGMLPVTVN